MRTGTQTTRCAAFMSELPTRSGQVGGGGTGSPAPQDSRPELQGGWRERVDGGRRGVVDSRPVHWGDQAWAQFNPLKKSEEAK
jgi:hypothetical protein